MVKHIAISVLGKDRPGIVAAISRTLFDAGCNIEDSSMTSLRSEFAMIVIVALPGHVSLECLRDRLSDTGKKLGLSTALRQLGEGENKPRAKKWPSYVLSVYGADKPGIVYTISDFLAKNRINITDVQTNVLGKGKSTVYVMFLEIDLPAHMTFARFNKSLAKIADTLKVTVTCNPVESAEL